LTAGTAFQFRGGGLTCYRCVGGAARVLRGLEGQWPAAYVYCSLLDSDGRCQLFCVDGSTEEEGEREQVGNHMGFHD
jgi:hypothetical protein